MRKVSVPRISRQVIALALCACWSAAWAVEWISVPSAPVYRGAVGTGTRAADGTSWFARRFVNAGEIRSAGWTVSGLGVFEVFVNGKRVGDDFLKPGFTHNGKTKYSFSYDVTDLLKSADGDENVLAAEVSAGWWRDKIVTPEHTSSDRGFVGDKSAFRGELTIDYADGTRETIATGDDGWLCGVAGRVKHAAIYDGEEFDARERDPVLGDGVSERPEVNTEFKGDVLPSRGAEVTLRRDLEMVRGPYTLKKGTPLIVDFGQNCAAVPEFRFKAARGTVLTALPAEMLNDADAPERGCDGPKGSVYRANLRCPDEGMRLVYTFAGDGVESYLPRFTFFGYRYLSLTATDDVEIERIASVPVTSIGKDMELGRLETGDAAVNRLVSNIYWSQLSNYLSVPTDCPQRNERLGWTADTQVFCEAGAFNADTAAFFRKWMRDMRDTQDEKGGFPGVAPFAQYGSGANEMMRVGWADAGVVVPYKIWLMFGDRVIVDENWSAMERFMARVAQTKYRTENLPECDNFQWNDWLSLTRLESCPYKPELSAFEEGSARPKAEALLYWNYLGGCHWLMDAQMMAQMAAATGRDEAKYLEMAREARDYLRREFFGEDGRISPVLRGMQTPALFALKLGLVDHEAKEWMIADLKASFKANGGTFHTGFLGTSILLETLSECGLDSCAYDLLLNHSFPGWLYSVDQGATTVWERWNSYTKEKGFGPVDMNSFNHYAYGAVLAWMYKHMAGIAPDPKAPGFRRIILAPKPDRRMGFVKVAYKSAVGLVESEWHYENEDWIWNFTVPDGATACVTVPGEEARDYGPGTYWIRRPGRQGAAIGVNAAPAMMPQGEQERALAAILPEVFEQAAAHYRALDAAATPLMHGGPDGAPQVPHGFKRVEGCLDMQPVYWWTAGHFPGSLWYLYEATGDDFFKDRARAWTELLAPNAAVTDNHDVGFIMYCSFGNARRLLGTRVYDALLLETANSLSRRFSEKLGLIRSWGDIDDETDFLVIPDNLMNLELLEWAAKAPGGDGRFNRIARSHADATMKHHYRPDGGTFHVLNYDPRAGFCGAVQEVRRGQGLSCETAWARGQAWSIYGYTMMFRETRERRYLDFAQKVADYALNHPNMPEDGVPYWDFGAPGEERDTSAAAVMASALLELSTFVGGEKGASYKAFAVRQLLALASPAYFSKVDEIGHWLLKHGVGHKPGGFEIDTPLNYGDYYFLEALLRFRRMSAGTAPAPMTTPWGVRVTDENCWRSYPRPQMVRANWTNLNGAWDYAVTSVTNTPGRPEKWDGQIRVPYPIESALSGVGRLLGPDEFLWYTRKIVCDPKPGERILLHFGGVDFRTMVFIGHDEVTDVPHEGGQNPFTLDITDFVKPGENDLTVCVWDPTEDFVNSRGKQSFLPHECFYTRVSGIWQTVWMETVPEQHIKSYKVVTDIDKGTVTLEFKVDGTAGATGTDGTIEILCAAAPLREKFTPGKPVTIELPAPVALWSPENPQLYDFTAKFGTDEIRGYFGMRKFEKRRDEKGVQRFFLNNEPCFLLGTLDQGWWPDGLLTPPSEEAMEYDVKVLKACGFNMLRKHIKVEPQTYYAMCDRVGILVLQDLPSGSESWLDPARADTVKRYHLQRLEMKEMMDDLQPFPSIVMWNPYNEGWSQPGEFLTHSMLDFTRRHDPTRLVNGPSGCWDWEGGHLLPKNWAWTNRVETAHRPEGVCEAADTVDMHLYRGPAMFEPNGRRVSILGEFGGLGHPVAGHLWKAQKDGEDSWGYGGIEDTKTREGLEKAYLDLMAKVGDMAERGLGGAIYTQTTDVEIEINGLLTYDRRVLKFDPAVLKKAHESVIRRAVGENRSTTP